MREIKFRAWEYAKKEWHYFHIPQDIGRSVEGMSHKLNYEHWTEFTGLTDKNGKEIFEGDIVKFKDPTNDDPNETGWARVVWSELKCAFLPQDIEENHKGGHYLHYWDMIYELEVIGNIYQEGEG